MPDIDYDNLPAQIDALHDDAEELAERAKNCADDETAEGMRADAVSKVRLAARLRAAMES